VAKAIAEDCVEAGVGRVCPGWPKEILRTRGDMTSKWAGRLHGFWSFVLVLSRLERALEARGIEAVRVCERGLRTAVPPAAAAMSRVIPAGTCAKRRMRTTRSPKDGAATT